MENNIRISESFITSLTVLNVPWDIINKLTILEGRKYKDYNNFDEEIVSLFGNEIEKYKDEIIKCIEIIEDDEDTETQETYSHESIYPYDPTKADIHITEEPQTVYELVIRKWDFSKLKIDPKFQRNFVWKEDKQSLFIESILLNFPLPPFYINKDSEDNYIVVDGRQRITTLRNFLTDDNFRLQGLKALPQLNGKNFRDLVELNSKYRTKIEDRKLNIYVIQPTVPLEMVYDIFHRINRGGTQLEQQEIRNCIYIGRATDFLDKLAKKECFINAIDNGISSLRKKNEEAVLRYLSFQIQNYENDYKGSMTDFVEKTMRKINKELSNEELKKIEENFEKSMKFTFDFFGSSNFRIPTENTRGRVNIAVLESVSSFFAKQSSEFLLEHKKRIKSNYNKLIKYPEYLNAVRFSTGDKQRVKNRFEIAREILGNID